MVAAIPGKVWSCWPITSHSSWVHAEGRNDRETQELLAGMEWVEGRDRKGLDEWALSYPVGKYRGFAYPRNASRREEAGFFELLQREIPRRLLALPGG